MKIWLITIACAAIFTLFCKILGVNLFNVHWSGYSFCIGWWASMIYDIVYKYLNNKNNFMI